MRLAVSRLDRSLSISDLTIKSVCGKIINHLIWKFSVCNYLLKNCGDLNNIFFGKLNLILNITLSYYPRSRISCSDFNSEYLHNKTKT